MGKKKNYSLSSFAILHYDHDYQFPGGVTTSGEERLNRRGGLKGSEVLPGRAKGVQNLLVELLLTQVVDELVEKRCVGVDPPTR